MASQDSDYGAPPTQYGSLGRLRGSLPSSSPLSSRGQSSLSTLLRKQSNSSLGVSWRRSSFTGYEPLDDEEAALDLDFRRADPRRLSAVLEGPRMRSMRLIGNSNPRYHWEQYWKTEEELKSMRKPIRAYYRRTNSLIQQYNYIDRLLDSSLPHNLLNEYYNTPCTANGSGRANVEVPPTITEEPPTPSSSQPGYGTYSFSSPTSDTPGTKKIKRTPRELYRVSTEDTPLVARDEDDEDDDHYDGPKREIPGLADDDSYAEGAARAVLVAIYVNLAANVALLAGKVAVTLLTSSLSVLASLVDGALDLLSTAIIWAAAWLIARRDRYRYPVGRRRLEPIGVLVFSVVILTSFLQVALACLGRLTEPSPGERRVVELGTPALAIMVGTVLVKGGCWLWCRQTKNSGVQALAQDAMTDIVFNFFSIVFPLVGFYARLWWLDPLGGLLLSVYVIANWGGTSAGHVRNLAGAAATSDERNVLLYLTMRFARCIRQIQGLQAYHAGDKLNVEVDIVLDELTTLRDSHDLGESLQYVLESVPSVDRAFVHQDYAGWNIPNHMEQQAD